MRNCQPSWLAAALGLLAATHHAAHAQQYYPAAPAPDSAPQVYQASAVGTADLLHRLEALEAHAAEMKAADAAKAEACADDKSIGGWNYGAWTDVSGEKWKVRFGGRLHMDYWNWMNDESNVAPAVVNQQNFFDVRRLRLDVAGEGWGVFDFLMSFDFAAGSDSDFAGPPFAGDDNGVLMRELWLGVNEIPWLGALRLGNHKTPNGLEMIASSNDMAFMERALPTVFLPRQQVGVTQLRQFNNGLGTLSTGAYFANIDQLEKNRFDDEQGLILAGRATYLPWYDEPSNGRYFAHVGASFAYVDDQDDTVRFAAFPETSSARDAAGDMTPYIDTGDLGATDYWLAGAEAALVYGSASLQGEYFWVHVNDAGSSDLFGAYLYASYFLTGEHRSYNRAAGCLNGVRPLENFWIVPGCMGKGAWEVLARWSYLDFTQTPGVVIPGAAPAATADRLHNLTLGLNWYWNPHTRVMLNYIHAIQDDNAQLHNSDILGASMRFDF